MSAELARQRGISARPLNANGVAMMVLRCDYCGEQANEPIDSYVASAERMGITPGMYHPSCAEEARRDAVELAAELAEPPLLPYGSAVVLASTGGPLPSPRPRQWQGARRFGQRGRLGRAQRAVPRM